MIRKFATYAFLPLTSAYYARHPSIRILMYHRVASVPAYDQLVVSPGRFEEQMEHLAARFRVIGLPDAVEEIAAGGPARGGVAITFDDGYRDNAEHALPILRKYGLAATIFVAGRFCDQSLRHPRYLSEAGRLHLDWDEVRELAGEPGITIGSHTMSHPFLSRLPEADARAEIADSRRAIASRTGRDVDFFCYPSGDFTARESAMVKAAGYRAAVSVAPGANRAGAALLSLRRTEITDRDAAAEFSLKLRGAFDPLHAVLHGRRERVFARARAAGGESARGSAE